MGLAIGVAAWHDWKAKAKRRGATDMAKRQDESSKDKSARAKKAKPAKALSASEVIMTMTTKDAERYRTILRNAWSR